MLRKGIEVREYSGIERVHIDQFLPKMRIIFSIVFATPEA
jgi:hypothetical protein